MRNFTKYIYIHKKLDGVKSFLLLTSEEVETEATLSVLIPSPPRPHLIASSQEAISLIRLLLAATAALAAVSFSDFELKMRRYEQIS